MRIAAKASSLINARGTARNGAESFEFQIMKDQPIDYEEIDEICGILPITSVHTLLRENTDICLDDLSSSEFTLSEFLKTMKLADHLSREQGFPVKLILHASTNVVTDDTAAIVSQAMKLFNAILLIENTGRHPNEKNGNAMPDATPGIIKKLRAMCPDVDPERFGTVLDTCHAMVALREHVPEGEYSIEDFFREHVNDCRIIHFANSRMPDEGPNHGCGFDTADEKRLAMMLYDMVKKYAPQADLVLEVAESDYTNAVNFRNTAALIRKCEERYDTAD